MADAHETMARASEVLDRASANRLNTVPGRRRDQRIDRIGARIARIAIADTAILIAAFVLGLIMPLGIFGALAVMALLVATTVVLAIYPTDRAPAPETLRTADLRILPAQTTRWLDAQRPALPAPAMTLVDQIGVRLDALAPQLAGIGDDSAAGAEIRKLVGEQLPDFVKDYTRVPAGLRTIPRNGRTPDAQLLDGLALIDRQIGQMTAQLAQGDLDSLATRGRFLEIKYRGDDGAV